MTYFRRLCFTSVWSVITAHKLTAVKRDVNTVVSDQRSRFTAPSMQYGFSEVIHKENLNMTTFKISALLLTICKTFDIHNAFLSRLIQQLQSFKNGPVFSQPCMSPELTENWTTRLVVL